MNSLLHTTVSPCPQPRAAVRRRGLAMVMVMVALAVCTIIVLTFLSGQTTSMAIAHNSSRQTQARAIAEDAVALVMEHVRATPEWRDDYNHGVWTPDQPLNGGTFRAMFEDEEDVDLSDDLSESFTLTVQATFDGVAHRTVTRVVPGASGNRICVMIVTGSAFHADEDLLRIAQIKAWGYTTVDVADSDSQAAFDAAAALADVIYVSEESASGSVGTKLNGYEIGVINEEQALQDELKMSSGGGIYTGNSIDITDSSHPITAGFPTGVLQITDVSTGLIQAGGTPASGLTTLAEREASSTKVLTVIDVGDTLTDGSPSPQRRVTVPWGSNSFEFQHLNDDGRKLMKQAIDWAAGSTSTLTALPDPISLWKFEEAAGSIATDSMGGHGGIHRSGTTLAATGQSAYAVEFNGSSGYVEIAHHDDYLVDNGAIAFWFYLDDLSGRQELFSKDSSGYDTGGHITIHANGDDVELRYQSTGTSYTLDSGSTLSAGTWHHAAFTFGADGMKLYVDGVLVDSDSYTGGMGTSSGGTGNFEPIALGANTWSSGNFTVSPLNYYLDGRLDEVGFYGEQLSAEQVLALYENLEAVVTEGTAEPSLMVLYEFIEPAPVNPTLVGHWKLDELAGVRGQLAVGNRVWIEDTAEIDSYDSSAGGYVSTQAGAARVISNGTGSDIFKLHDAAMLKGDAYGGPGGDTAVIFDIESAATHTGALGVLPVSAEFDVPAAPSLALTASSQTDTTGTDRTISADTRYGSWMVLNTAKITIDGDVTIVVDDNCTFDRGSLHITAGSTLNLYVGNNLYVNNTFELNNDSTAVDRLNIYLPTDASGSHLAYLRGDSVTAGRIFAGDDLSVIHNAVFYGTAAVTDTIIIQDDARVHTDTAQGDSGGVKFAVDHQTIRDGGYRYGAENGLVGVGDGGTAAGLDGTDDFIEVPHDDAYLLNEGTVSFWMYADDLSGRQGLIAKDATNYGTGGHFRVYLNGSTLECRLQSDSSSMYVTASSSITANTWHHVAVGFGPGGLRIYVDGVEKDADGYTGGLGTSSGGTGNHEPWTFGADQWHASDLSSDGWDDPFHGRLDDVRLYDKNLSEDQAADLAALNEPGAAALATVEDTANVGTPLDLNIADIDNVTWISGGGLTLDSATTISSNGGVGRLYNALTGSKVFTLQAEFTPANITQDGPARIVTYSNGTSSRNFHLGQTDAKYGARLRTEFNSSGTPEVESGDVLVVDTKEHVIFTYDGEEIRLYRNGTLEVTEAWTGDLDNWNSAYELVLGNEVGGSRPWLGTLHRVAIWDGSVNQVQADNLFNGSDPGQADGGDEGFDFVVEWLEKP